MVADHEPLMRVALEEARKGKDEGNHAVGSIIVRDGVVVARGRNTVVSTSDPTAHAETVAIREAGAAGLADLSGTTLYTTFEPCPMCCGAIMEAGVAVLVMGGRNTPETTRWGGYTVEKLIEMAGHSDQLEVVTGVLVQECVDIRG